jgi:hypothetical protein
MLKDETYLEFLSRVVSNLKMEGGWIVDELKSIDAILDFFDLWEIYDTDFLEGIVEAIQSGENPGPAIKFCKKHKIGWIDIIQEAIDNHKKEEASSRKKKCAQPE